MMNKKNVESYKRTVKEIVQRDNIIEGIFNYCDRWCEKCTHTAHCSVFLIEEETKNPESNDMNNKEFWDKMTLVFQASFEMLSDMAKEHGIDLDSIEIDDTPREKPEKSEVEVMAMDYGKKIYEWLKGNNDFLQKRAELFSQISEEKVISLGDALEIIQWYMFFISVKANRATSVTKLDDETDIYDNLGSAKIALIAINRSIEALSFLYEQIKEKEDDILDFLVLLSRIKKQLEKQFPKAWEFKRPGFDD